MTADAPSPVRKLADLLGRADRWASVMAWATVAGIAFGLSGPFGSYEGNFFYRLIYWTSVFWVGSIVAWTGTAIGLVLGPRKGFPPLFSIIAILIIACIPLAALDAAITSLFWPLRASNMRALEWYGLTLSVTVAWALTLAWIELGEPVKFRVSTKTRGSLPRELAAFEVAGQQGVPDGLRLPDYILSSAMCLQMEDHHIRIHVRDRSYLFHGVMRDVVAALDEQRGLRVHRSWWVDKEAVQGWFKADRSVVLVLKNGLHVPVARNRVALIRTEGWLTSEELVSPMEALLTVESERR